MRIIQRMNMRFTKKPGIWKRPVSFAMRSILIVAIMIVAYSCSSALEKKVVGGYTIEVLHYKNKPITHKLGANMMSFRGNGKCRLPIILDSSDLYTEEKFGKWSVNKENSSVKIESKHTVLNGEYLLKFEKDYENELLKIELENDSVYLKASKLMQNFDSKKDDW